MNLERGRQPAGTKIKVLEDGGRGAMCGLVRSNPFPREKCHRVNSQLCFQQDGKRSLCEKENIGYDGECARCPPRRYAYIGETSNTGYTRLSQHLAAYRAAAAAREPAQPQPPPNGSDLRPKAPKSWMWEHTRDMHAGIVGSCGGMEDYKVKVIEKFQKCLYRQVDEDVRMQQFETAGGVLLNSKYEYFMPNSVQPVFRQH